MLLHFDQTKYPALISALYPVCTGPSSGFDHLSFMVQSNSLSYWSDRAIAWTTASTKGIGTLSQWAKGWERDHSPPALIGQRIFMLLSDSA